MIDGPSGNIQLEEAPCSSWSFFNGGRTDINIILVDHGRAPDEGALLGTEGGGPQNLANHRVQSIEVGIPSTNEVNERLSSFQHDRHDGGGAGHSHSCWIALRATHFSKKGQPACLPIDAHCMFVAIPRAPIDHSINDHRLARDPSPIMRHLGARESRGGRRGDGYLAAVESPSPT